MLADRMNQCSLSFFRCIDGWMDRCMDEIENVLHGNCLRGERSTHTLHFVLNL